VTDFSKVGIARLSIGSYWYAGYECPPKMGVTKDHIHVLPLGFPRLAVMQAGRYWKGGSVTSVGYKLAKEDR
jgi:hypothetical protein